MELKKSDKANLERKRITFTLVGLLAASSLILLGFEYPEFKISYLDTQMDDTEMRDQVFNEEDNLIEKEEEEEEIQQVIKKKKPQVLNFENVEVTEDESLEDESFADDLLDLPEEDEELPAMDFPAQPAEYPGGEAALMAHIRDNTVYPAAAQDSRTQGIVMLKFVVEKDGSVGKVEVLRGLGMGLDKEAIRVVKSLDRFAPAENAGIKVRAWFRLPIRFTLQ
jgi:periplasmic protein TonB